MTDDTARCAALLLTILAVLLPSTTLADTAPATTQANEAKPANAAPINGKRVWHGRYVSDPDQQDELLGFCQSEGINLLLLQVHYRSDSQPVVINHPQRYVELIGKAADLGIRVEALDGEKSMALSQNQEHTLAVLRAILDLNATMPKGKRFVGLHYDIEPYLLEDWADPARRTQIMSDLLDYYTKARELIRESDPDMTLACDIPFWFDTPTSEDGLPLALEFAGQTKPIQQHIQDLCDYVGIMSYRTTAVGPNSITEIVENEVAYAQSIGKTVCPAVETAAYPPVPSISFHGQTAQQYSGQFDLAWNTLADRPGFGGMLIHCYPNVRELLESGSESDQDTPTN